MTYWRMTNGVRKHHCIAPDEHVYHACYGLSQSFVELANKSKGKASLNLLNPNAWKPETTGSVVLASPLNRTGVLAVTNRRLLFFKKRFSIGRVKHLAADWPLKQVGALNYEKAGSNLLIEFEDGSAAGLHVPWIQGPEKLIKAFDELKQSSG